MTPADPRTDRLARLVAGLGAGFGVERSFRVGPGAILDNRLLLSVAAADVPGDRVRDLCRELGLPADEFAAIDRPLAAARFVHFGFEGGQTGGLYKVYFEAALPPGGVDGGESVPLHLAYKWDADRPAGCVLTRYLWHPGLSAAGMLARLAEVFADPGHAEPLDIARGVLRSAAERTAPGEVRYLEVTEAGGPRRSFDVNLYPAGLRVEDVYPYLSRMGRHFAVPAGRFRQVYDRARSDSLGHLAGGTHRDGRPFLTVYHGARAGLAEPSTGAGG